MRLISCSVKHSVVFSGCVPIENKLGGGKMLRNDTKDNEIVYRFYCNPGYCLIGSPVISCFEGKWNGSKPSCQKGKQMYWLSKNLFEGGRCLVDKLNKNLSRMHRTESDPFYD